MCPAATTRRLSSRRLVAREFARALADAALVPARLFDDWVRREHQRALLRDDLTSEPVWPERDEVAFPRRPLSVFLSCAEVSGEIHAAHFARELRARAQRTGEGAEVRLRGWGSASLESEGVACIARPVERAAMGFGATVRQLPYYMQLLRGAADEFLSAPPDVCVLVDSPALHVPLGHIARRCGVPVVHFVAPQYWAWAPWRVDGYRSAVDRALTILPFEPAWFARHDVASVHVGHPLLDALANVPANEEPPANGVLALLPGSRRSVIDRNLPWMLRAIDRLRERVPDLRVVLPHARPELHPLLLEHVRQARAEDHVSIEADLHDALARTRAAFSVSGTALIDLLHHRVPTTVVYRFQGGLPTGAYAQLISAPWFASVNLLAGTEVYPEFAFRGEGPMDAIVSALERSWRDEEWRARNRLELERARRRLGPPGACARAVDETLALVAERATAEPQEPQEPSDPSGPPVAPPIAPPIPPAPPAPSRPGAVR